MLNKTKCLNFSREGHCIYIHIYIYNVCMHLIRIEKKKTLWCIICKGRTATNAQRPPPLPLCTYTCHYDIIHSGVGVGGGGVGRCWRGGRRGGVGGSVHKTGDRPTACCSSHVSICLSGNNHVEQWTQSVRWKIDCKTIFFFFLSGVKLINNNGPLFYRRKQRKPSVATE